MSTYIERLAAMEGAPTLKPLVVDQGRDAYLAWVKHWKECYAWITREIRHARISKRHHRDLAREGVDREQSRSRMWRADTRASRLSIVAHHWHMCRLEGKAMSWQAKCQALGVPNDRDPELSQEEAA